jgi:magnesium transporter
VIYTFDIRRGYLWEQDVQPDNGEALLACHWIDLVDAQDAERDLIQQVLTATLPDSDEVDEIEASARYFTDEEGMHVHSLFLYQSEGRHKTTTVAFILQPQRLLTLRDNEVRPVKALNLATWNATD